MINNKNVSGIYVASPHGLITLYVYIYCMYSHRKGGGELTKEQVRGATVHKVGSKIPT